jgi:hypothetical protein
MHLETIAFSATAPGAAGAAAAALTGDSLTVKNSKGPAHVIAMWAHNQSDGFHQLIFPSGHDTTRGWRTVVEAGSIDQRFPLGCRMAVQPQELISATIAGSATAGDVETGVLLVQYDDLPGVNARLIDWVAMSKRAEAFVTVQATLTGAAAGYTGAELITSESDLLRANRDYAVLGIETSTDTAAIVLDGPDTGYARISCPGNAARGEFCGAFFGTLSKMLNGAETIPVINSGNKTSTNLRFIQNENNISPVVSVNLVLLKAK